MSRDRTLTVEPRIEYLRATSKREPHSYSLSCQLPEPKDMQKFGAMPNFILDHQLTEETYGKS
jgi:hypothetical protein